jgi:hypothetical protein
MQKISVTWIIKFFMQLFFIMLTGSLQIIEVFNLSRYVGQLKFYNYSFHFLDILVS